jgi:2-iminobutanoate/2-iminopropanoate deaminase
MKTLISTPKAPVAIGPYSQGTRAGNLVFLSGQLGIDPATGALATGGVAAQAVQSLKNIQALLEEVQASPEDIVKTTVFLTDMADFKAVNEAYAAVFSQNCPARSCVAVAQLPLGGLVEIEAIVAL